jgi:hypothetical protein
MTTTSPKCRYAKFLSQFDFKVWNGHTPSNTDDGMIHVRWHANVGYVDFGYKTPIVARIELSDLGYKGMFDKFDVQVIHRSSGRLDTITFNFGDYFTKDDRSDNRVKDMPDQVFYAWSGSSSESSVDWYIARPKSVAALVQAVNEYLRMWRTMG